MDTSRLAFILISHFEGCRLAPYRCPAGRWSIGYGATHLRDGAPVTENTSPLTTNEATALLADSIQSLCATITAWTVGHTVTPYQMAALVSFSYNVGVAGLRSSTLLRKFLLGDTQGAADEFLHWDKMHLASGVVVESPGLLKRREAERAMFLGKPDAL
ncbi:lysozyme [Bombella pollinis]|uniref:lysozyme n=1 Tax=Bombella pollinis TaxID=2967337 RepID=UPI0038993E0E